MGGACFWKKFCVSKRVGLDNKIVVVVVVVVNKNGLKQLKTAGISNPWAYIREGLLSEGLLRLRFGGLNFDLFKMLNFLIISLIFSSFFGGPGVLLFRGRFRPRRKKLRDFLPDCKILPFSYHFPVNTFQFYILEMSSQEIKHVRNSRN